SLPKTHPGVATSGEVRAHSGSPRSTNACRKNLELVYDVIPAIDIKGFAGDKLCRIVREEGGRGADVVDADEAASGSLCLRFVKQLVKFGDSGGGASRKRSGRNGVDANSLWAKFGRHVADCAFQRRLGDAHDVVVFHDHLPAVIGHREQRSAPAYQRLGKMSHANE